MRGRVVKKEREWSQPTCSKKRRRLTTERG